MKRLRELEPGSPLLEQAKVLLDAAEPVPESYERMLRVRRELDRPRGLLLRVRQLSALALAAIVVLFGASAFAAVRIFEAVVAARAAEQTPASAAPVAPRGAKRAALAAPKAAAAPPSAIVAAPQPPEPETAPEAAGADRHATHARARTPGTAARTPGTAARRPPVQDISAPAVEPAPPPEAEAAAQALIPEASDSELVHRAVKALRRDRDPALAARLLEAHRARSPEGPLAEEALALHIEALLALRAPRATALASEYLSRYPQGRYAGVARRALGEPPP